MNEIYGTDKVICETRKEKGRPVVLVECIICNKQREVLLGKLKYGSAKKCECQLSLSKRLKIGDTFVNDRDNDTIIDIKSNGRLNTVTIRCNKCNSTREMPAYQFSTNRHTKCHCSSKRKINSSLDFSNILLILSFSSISFILNLFKLAS